MNTANLGGVLRKFYARVRKMQMESVFLAIFLFFGVTFIAVVPPGWNSDETNHTFRIYQLASGNVLSEQVIDSYANTKAYGGNVPANLVTFFQKTIASEPGSVGNRDRKIGNVYSYNKEILNLKDDGKKTSMYFSGAALYSPVSYIVYLPIVLLGSLLSLPFFWIIIFCRLAGLAITGLAIYFAIKIIPIGKWILFTVGLLPVVVVQSAAVGADSPQLAACFLFIAYIVRLVYSSKKISYWDFGILAALGIWLTLIKLAYAPLILLILALPLIKKEYRIPTNAGLLFLTVAVSLIPAIMWSQMVSYVDVNSNPQANIEAQKDFVLSAPIAFLKTLYFTFLTNAQTAPLGNLYGSFIWDSTPLPSFYAYIAAAAVILSLFVKSVREPKSVKLTKKQVNIWRALIISVVTATILLIATTLYMYSTTYRQSSIVGIQSRYFIPLLPLILLIFYGNTVRNQRSLKLSIIIMSCIVLTGAVLTIHFRLYYVLQPLIN